MTLFFPPSCVSRTSCFLTSFFSAWGTHPALKQNDFKTTNLWVLIGTTAVICVFHDISVICYRDSVHKEEVCFVHFSSI